MNIVTPAEMEEIDRATIKDHGLNSLVLMENAARSTISYLPEGKVGVLVGPGNNGGDGLVIARVLAEQGRSVEVLLLTEKRSTDAEANLQLAVTTFWRVTKKRKSPGSWPTNTSSSTPCSAPV